MKQKRAVISQPMNGKSEDQIREDRAGALENLALHGYEIVDTIFPDFIEEQAEGNIPLKYLAKSLEAMANADLVYFVKGWKKARGCRIEHQCCVEYGLKTAEEAVE